MSLELPSIPPKRYFTIGEVSDLCGVKPHVLRYWEQEFTQLRPVKRRGNRRYYQHHEVLLIRKIRELLYDRGFTISGARNQLGDSNTKPSAALIASPTQQGVASRAADAVGQSKAASSSAVRRVTLQSTADVREELQSIRDTLLF